MKTCALCKVEKENSEFSRNSRNRDGLHSYCKECNKLKAKMFNKTDKGKINVKNAQKKQFDSGYFRYGKGAIANMSRGAQKRGIEFGLTEEILHDWWHKTPDICEYCGNSIEEYMRIKNYICNYTGDDYEVKRFKRFFQQEIYIKISDMTIDRKNNAKGYTLDNIVKSCWICNSLKSDFFTEKEMRSVGGILFDEVKVIMEKGDTNEGK